MSASGTKITGLVSIIALLTMIGPFTIDTYLPSFPAIEAEFSISRLLLSQSLGTYLLAFSIATLAAGPLADRLGRRTVILVSLLIYIVSSIGCAISQDYQAFLLFRVCQGIAAAGGLVAGRAIVRDVFPPQQAHRAMSRIIMLFALAPAVAPIIGGILHELYGWRSIFYFLALFALVVWVLFIMQIPETLTAEHKQSFHPVKLYRLYASTLTHQRFMFLCFIVAFYFAGIFLYIAGAPTVIYDFLQLDTRQFGYLFIPMVAGIIAGSFISGSLSYKWKINRTIHLAMMLMVIGTSLNLLQVILFQPSLIISILPLCIFTMGVGIAMPAMSVLALDCFPKNRGTASAMQSAIQMTANGIAASVLVPLLNSSPVHFALGQFALLCIAMFLWCKLPEEAQNEVVE